MMNKVKKICITAALIVCLCQSKNIYAYDRPMSYINLNPCTDCTYEPVPSKIDRYREDLFEYRCEYLDNLFLGRIVSINAYDEQERTIIPFSEISLVKFKAGTWIGMNLREKKQGIWNISNENYTQIYAKYKCTYPIKREYVEYCTVTCPNACEKCAEAQAKLAECKKKAEELAAAVAAAAAQGGAAAAAAASGGGGVDCSSIDMSSCETCAACTQCCTPPEEKDVFDPVYYPPPLYKATACPDPTTACIDKVTPMYPHAPENDEEHETQPVESCTARMIDTVATKVVNHVTYATIQVDILLDNKGFTAKSLGNEFKIRRFTNSKILIDEQYVADNEKVQETLNAAMPYKFDKVKEKVEDPELEKTNLPSDDFIEGIRKTAHWKEYESDYKNSDAWTHEELAPYKSGEYHSTFEYSPDNVCIDMKTSNVFYETHKKYSPSEDNPDCTNEKNTRNNNSNGETIVVDVPDGKTVDPEMGEEIDYWHYFIPLDTHTTSAAIKDDIGFYIGLTDGSPMDGDYCAQILETFPMIEVTSADEQQLVYRDFITPNVTGQQFVGDYYGGSQDTGDDSDGSTPGSLDYQLVMEYGCLFTVQTRFNIEQNFYGEIEEERKGKKQLVLKGYGFYYRPIDIHKPFPNPLAVDSIWVGLYDESKNQIVVENVGLNVSLDQSFDTLTYSTHDVSLREVRNATNSGEKYTSWEEMRIRGTSDFVRDFELRRNVSLDKLYTIGCGPDNKDWVGCGGSSNSIIKVGGTE